MSEKDYLRKKNKFLPKIHAWYCFYPKFNYYSRIVDELMHSKCSSNYKLRVLIFRGSFVHVESNC